MTYFWFCCVTWPKIALSFVSSLVMPHFYKLFHIDITFKKQYIWNINCLFWFSLQSVYETFIVRQIERGITINEHMSSCKVPVPMNKFSLKLKFLNRFLKNSQILIFKYGQWKMSCSMVSNDPTDKQTGRIQ